MLCVKMKNISNVEIATLLRNVAASYTIKNEKKYRFQIIAYQKAADAVEGSTAELKDLYQENKLDQIPGVGPSIQQHLEELFKTGKVKHFDWVFSDIPHAVFPLLLVPSFGPKKAYKLVKEFHLRNPETVISDIEKIAMRGKIRNLEGFGEKSESDIIRAVSEFRMGSGKTTRMVLPFAYTLAEKIVDYLKKSTHVKEAFPLGSLRRMKSTIGDVDIAVSSNDPQEVIAHFTSYPYIERVIEKGEVGASILTSGGKQVDLLIQPPEMFGSLLQHFTGSKHHNVHLREYALKQNMSLSERGIKQLKTKNKKLETYKTEESFYHALGMDWIPPELREDTGEIEVALDHKLPHLVETKDIKGDLHIHSSFPIEPSHDMGKDSMEDMLKKAKELGYEYLGFSEHNPSISKHKKEQTTKLLLKRKGKIEEINKKDGVKAISLMETDILPNGKLALTDDQLSLLDATLVSIHSSFSMNKEDMTKRILSGLSHPKAKILTHPTGRLLNERKGYEIDFDAIFEFCKKHDKAIEINSWPSRLDLPDIMVKQAILRGVKLVINSDAHAIWQMDMMKFGVSVARRGWAEKKNILNTLGYKEFMKWLKS